MACRLCVWCMYLFIEYAAYYSSSNNQTAGREGGIREGDSSNPIYYQKQSPVTKTITFFHFSIRVALLLYNSTLPLRQDFYIDKHFHFSALRCPPYFPNIS
jgi:hypothetical protein